MKNIYYTSSYLFNQNFPAIMLRRMQMTGYVKLTSQVKSFWFTAIYFRYSYCAL